MEQTKTFKLSAPIEANGETVTELTLKRPKTKNLRVVDAAKGEIASTIDLIANLASVPPSAIDQMELEDFAAIGEWVSSFLPERLLTGAKS